MNDDKLWRLFVIPLTGLGLIVIALGTFHYLVDIGPNKCQMTFMFEYPIYMKLDLPHHVKNRSPQYQLYAYSEGTYTSKGEIISWYLCQKCRVLAIGDIWEDIY